MTCVEVMNGAHAALRLYRAGRVGAVDASDVYAHMHNRRGTRHFRSGAGMPGLHHASVLNVVGQRARPLGRRTVERVNARDPRPLAAAHPLLPR